MATATMRVTNKSLETVRYLASLTGQKQQEVVDSAIEAYRRHIFLDQANSAFATLRNNVDAWDRETTERASWDNTLADTGKGS